MKASKYFLSTLSLAIMISFTLTGCGDSSESTSAEVSVIKTSVETEVLSDSKIQEYKTISSNILADSEIAVIPKVGGTVSKVHVKIGDHVKAGDLLFEIDSRDLELQVKSAQQSVSTAQSSVSTAQSSVSSAQAGLNSAKATYDMNTGSTLDNQLTAQRSSVENLERQYNDLVQDLEEQKLLLEIGAISQDAINTLESQVATAKTNLDQAKSQLKTLEEKTINETKRVAEASVAQAEASVSSAEASVKQAQSQVAQSQVSLESAKQQLSYTQVRAEIDGIISSCNISAGSTVSAGSVALNIVDMDQVKITFNVTDDLINRIHVGDTVYTSIEAVSEEPFAGTISTVAPAANNQTGLYPIEISIDNPNHTLKPGMLAISKVVLAENEHTLSVPIDAILKKGEEKYIFTIDANHIAHKVIVETGIENDTHIEILSGATLNDTVVVKGQDYLTEGSAVNIVNAN